MSKEGAGESVQQLTAAVRLRIDDLLRTSALVASGSANSSGDELARWVGRQIAGLSAEDLIAGLAQLFEDERSARSAGVNEPNGRTNLLNASASLVFSAAVTTPVAARMVLLADLEMAQKTALGGHPASWRSRDLSSLDSAHQRLADYLEERGVNTRAPLPESLAQFRLTDSHLAHDRAQQDEISVLQSLRGITAYEPLLATTERLLIEAVALGLERGRHSTPTDRPYSPDREATIERVREVADRLGLDYRRGPKQQERRRAPNRFAAGAVGWLRETLRESRRMRSSAGGKD